MEGAGELFGEIQPTIKVRALDFVMIIHETVKGIYQLIASHSIPESEEAEKKIVKYTETVDDELEDLRYGPYIAKDIRDFINKNPKANKVKNVREFVYGELCQLPPKEFSELIKGDITRDYRSQNKD